MEIEKNENTINNEEVVNNAKNEVAATASENQDVTKFTESQLEELKSKYGKLYQIKTVLEPDDETAIEKTFIFKKPKTISFDRYMKTVSTNTTKAAKQFMNDNIIPEQKTQLAEVANEYPAIIISINEKLLYALGMSKETDIKKL